MPANYNEDLLDKYPQLLAATYARFIDQRDPAAEHNLLMALFEALLKYVASASVGQYLALSGDDPATTDALSKLGHPSLGHWTALLRGVLTYRRKAELPDDDFVFPELAAYYSKPSAELVAGAELVRRLQKIGASKVSLRQVFDALVEYRNSQAHGAGQGGAQIAAIVPIIQAALEEILTLVDTFRRRLPYFVESIVADDGERTAHLIRMSSDRPRMRPLREPIDPGDTEPVTQQLFLLNGGHLAGGVSLHPLVVFIPACEVCGEPQLGILNGLGNKVARYLSYGCGHANNVRELFDAVTAFIPDSSGGASGHQATAAPTTPNNLPPEQTEFVGRDRDLTAILALRQRPAVRLVTLTGPGGTGKTRLALESAGKLLPEFDDGVWLVDLSALSDPALVVSTVSGVLGLGEEAGVPPIETLKKALADKEMLFVLDNFEQVMGAAPQVALLLKAAGRVQVLATSRMPLQVYGEKEYAVQPLAVPNRKPLPELEKLTNFGAVRLFVERARAVRADFELTEENAAAVAEICARLDGLPLAIELAAARTRLFPPPALLARLDHSLKILTGGARDLPARQQTMRGAIEWSYDLLSADEKRIFARLGVFAGGARLEEIDAICAGSSNLDTLDIDALEGVELLVSKSLLQQREGVGGEPRFAMLETIREYAREKMEAGGEVEALGHVHAARFLALAELAAARLTGNDQAEWLARLEEEQPNMRAALDFSFGPSGDLATGLRIAVALYRFWGVRGYWTEGRAWYDQALAAARSANVDPLLRANTLNAAGGLARLQSEFVAARALCAEALQQFRAAADKPGTAAALRSLAVVAVEQRELAAARQYGEEGLALYRELGDKAGQMVLLNDLGMAAHQEGDLAGALTLYEQGLTLRRQQGHKRGIAVALNNLGLIRVEQGDLEVAATLFDEAHDLLDGIGDTTGAAVVLTNLANLRQEAGDHHAAADMHRQNLKLFAAQNSAMRIAESLEGLAGPAASLEQPERAARLLAAAETLRETDNAPLPAWEQRRHERFLAAARRQLDPSAWQVAWQEGRNMDQSRAVAYGLADD